MDYPFSHQRRLAAVLEEAKSSPDAAGQPLSKTPTPKARARFVRGSCAALRQAFGEEGAAVIKRACACGPGSGAIQKARALYMISSSLAEFAERWNHTGHGFTVELEGRDIVIRYPRCYCGCVKDLPKPIDPLWCQCSVGYTQRNAEGVFGHPCAVALEGAVMRGDPECVLRIVDPEGEVSQ